MVSADDLLALRTPKGVFETLPILRRGMKMSRGPCTFRQKDVTRAVRAMEAAGIEVQRVEIDKAGKIIIVTGKPQPGQDSTRNEWDGIDGTHPA